MFPGQIYHDPSYQAADLRVQDESSDFLQ